MPRRRESMRRVWTPPSGSGYGTERRSPWAQRLPQVGQWPKNVFAPCRIAWSFPVTSIPSTVHRAVTVAPARFLCQEPYCMHGTYRMVVTAFAGGRLSFKPEGACLAFQPGKQIPVTPVPARQANRVAEARSAICLTRNSPEPVSHAHKDNVPLACQ